MIRITRRRLLACTASLLAFMLPRRRGIAAALPLPRRPPALARPMEYPRPVDAVGWWIKPNGWAYHPQLGWRHSAMPPRVPLTPATWYGPPPPLPPLIPLDWGEILRSAEVARDKQPSGKRRGWFA